MRVAITVWQDRISPVFDQSQWLHIFDVNGEQVDLHREYIGGPPFGKVERLKELAVDILICGAVTRPLHIDLVASDIDVFPFVCGNVNAVLDVFLKQNKIDSRFVMPGYGRRARKRNRRCAGHGENNDRRKNAAD